MDNWTQRIESILGNDAKRSEKNAIRYRVYLKESLSLPLRVTGREDFEWEEKYILGGWSKREYIAMKRDNPSYTDSFDLLDLLPAEENDDVTAKIKRISDGKVFTIGLSWLTTEDADAPEFEVLDDYASWHANY